MHDIFLSYSRDDQAAARRFAQQLEREGFSVWWDQTLSAGDAYDEVTEKALEAAAATVVLWSNNSVGSRWVRAEATTADRRGTLVPAMIEDCKRPIMFELRQTADLSHWKGDANDPAWRVFAEGLRRFTGKTGDSPAAVRQQPATSRDRPLGKWVTIVAAAVLAISAGIAWSLRGSAPSSDEKVSSVTLAVLPFANLSADREQDYFSDGLTEEILNALAQVPDLRVTGRTSSFSFKGRNEDLRSIAKQLAVENLLEGSIRKEGNRLRITAQLIDGRDGAHLWSKTYDRELKDVFSVQDEVSRDVAQALAVRLNVGDLSSGSGGTTNVAAYEKFLQARAAKATYDTANGEKAVELAREAVALDPTFGAAWVSMAQSLYDLPGSYANRPADAARLIAQALDHNVKTAPTEPWTQHLQAYDDLAHYRWAEAADATARVLATPYGSRKVVDPWANPPIYLRWASLLMVGRAVESFQLTDDWVRTDPLDLFASMVKIGFMGYAGRGAEVPAEHERSRTLDGDHSGAEYLYLLRYLLPHEPEGSAAVNRQLALVLGDNANSSTLLGRIFLKLADREAVLGQIRATLNDPSPRANWHMLMAFADHFGDRDLAIALLRKQVVDPPWTTPFQAGYALWFPFKTGLRADVRFKALVREIGLVDFWRRSGNWGDFCQPVGKEDFQCH
jgi:TolB-like protein